MKEVYTLRHANWNGKEDSLTDQGRKSAVERVASLPDFTVVYSSPFTRTQQTAEILSGEKPQVEVAASVPQTPAEIQQQILERRASHPLGIAGALFESKEAHPALQLAGTALAKLIRQILIELQDGQRALIVSHDGTMVAAERILNQTDLTKPLEQTYGELEGFVVDENLKVKTFKS